MMKEEAGGTTEEVEEERERIEEQEERERIEGEGERSRCGEAGIECVWKEYSERERCEAENWCLVEISGGKVSESEEGRFAERFSEDKGVSVESEMCGDSTSSKLFSGVWGCLQTIDSNRRRIVAVSQVASSASASSRFCCSSSRARSRSTLVEERVRGMVTNEKKTRSPVPAWVPK